MERKKTPIAKGKRGKRGRQGREGAFMSFLEEGKKEGSRLFIEEKKGTDRCEGK